VPLENKVALWIHLVGHLKSVDPQRAGLSLCNAMLNSFAS
jgi:hypothetical protein